MLIGRLGISAKWKYISGYLGKTALKFQTPAILCTATVKLIKRRLTEGWNLM
jgi:hypothetical protein